MDALTSLLRAHKEDREKRGVVQTKRVVEAMDVADSLENNFRAALVKELNSCVSNQNVLEVAVRQLRSQVVALSLKCDVYGRDHAALMASVDKLGTVPFLRATSEALNQANASLEILAGKISGLHGE
jgi:hypothetical protein